MIDARGSQIGNAVALGCLLQILPTQAAATVAISTQATSNMSCSGGVCSPTAADAVLNSTDLANLLAAGNVTVTTTGFGGVQATDVQVEAPFSWSSTSGLTLDAYQSIAIDRGVTVGGASAVTILTNDGGSGGTLSFGDKGDVVFKNLSGQLTVNGTGYMLVDTVSSLASAITKNPGGAFAFASSYDASHHRLYHQSPIATTFRGTFEGLGNTISHLRIYIGGKTAGPGGGLLASSTGSISHIKLAAVNVSAKNIKTTYVGTLVGVNNGTVTSSYVSGMLTAQGEKRTSATVGGLAGFNGGSIEDSSSSVEITANFGNGNLIAGGLVGTNAAMIDHSRATGEVDGGGGGGGLVGYNEQGGAITYCYATGSTFGVAAGGLVAADEGAIEYSFSAGPVTATFAGAGGLVGVEDYGTVSNSYATGSATGITSSMGTMVGGLIGKLYGNTFGMGTVQNAYSIGAVSAQGTVGDIYLGGLLGYDSSTSGDLTDTYWDRSTSGIKKRSQGAGNISNDPGITGLTTKEFRSGLPAGFDPNVWAEDRKINNGLPYLIANPPPKN